MSAKQELATLIDEAIDEGALDPEGMEDITCQPCHERIERAKAVLHEEINAMLAHHGQVAELLIITRQQDETFADQSLSHLDRVLQWTLGKLGRTP